MELPHHTHKETTGGWLDALADWRRSRARRRVKTERRIVTPWSR